MNKTISIPRIIWVNKSWSCKQIHHEIYKFFQTQIIRLYDEKELPPFKKLSIDEEEQGKPLSKEEFCALSIDDQF